MSKLPKSMATKGPQANAPSLNASAVPNSTGTAAAVRLKGLARRNHSLKTRRLGAVVIRAIVERVGRFCNLFRHQVSGYRHQVGLLVASPRVLQGAGPRCFNGDWRRLHAASLVSGHTNI